MSSQRRRRKKGRHCALLSRVQFRQSSCLTGFWHEGQSSNNPMLAAPVIECYPQVPGQHRPCFLADRVFFQSHVKVRGLRDERADETADASALREMQQHQQQHRRAGIQVTFWG